jgi:hypothetical protein
VVVVLEDMRMTVTVMVMVMVMEGLCWPGVSRLDGGGVYGERGARRRQSISRSSIEQQWMRYEGWFRSLLDGRVISPWVLISGSCL